MRTFLKVCLLSLPALLVSLVLLELVVFRSWVAVGDVPLEEYDDAAHLLHYRPSQAGVTFPDGDIRRPVPFSVNAEGWNSSHGSYKPGRSGKARIAVIGDSYVAAFEVAPTEALAEQLEAALGSERAEVYRFGMRGAPMSQYLHVARYVAATYAPDLIVIVLVHNDFDESYRIPPGRYASTFLHLRVEQGKVLGEIPPEPYREPTLSRWARSHSATLRFLLYRSAVARQLLHQAYGSLKGSRPQYQANVDVGSLATEDADMRAAALYTFEQIAKLERENGIRTVLLMDAPREPIYQGADPRQSAAYRLNRIAAEAASQAGIRLVDLTSSFESDFREHGKRFEFPRDGHWNAMGHHVAAMAACREWESGAPAGSPTCAS